MTYKPASELPGQLQEFPISQSSADGLHDLHLALAERARGRLLVLDTQADAHTMPGFSEPWDSALSDQICYASLWVSSYAEDVYAHSTLCAQVRQRNCHVLRVLAYLDSVQ